MLDDVSQKIIRPLGPIRLNALSIKDKIDVGEVFQHADGTLELSLALLPTGSSDIEFEYPSNVNEPPEKRPIYAVVTGAISSQKFRIGTASVEAGLARATFDCQPPFDAQFIV